MLFAVEITDALTGSAGLVSTITSGGVLTWLLLRGLPDKDKQIDGLVKSRDELVSQLHNRHATIIKELAESQVVADRERRADHKGVIDMVLNHCQRENAQISTVMTRALDEVTGAVIDLRRAIEERRDKQETEGTK